MSRPKAVKDIQKNLNARDKEIVMSLRRDALNLSCQTLAVEKTTPEIIDRADAFHKYLLTGSTE